MRACVRNPAASDCAGEIEMISQREKRFWDYIMFYDIPFSIHAGVSVRRERDAAARMRQPGKTS